MATSPPLRPFVPPGLPANISARSFVRALQSELDIEADPARKALLQYEIAAMTEHKLEEQEGAVALYSTAYALNERFRPPLSALMRIYEGRRFYKNLEGVFRHEAQASQNDAQRASALTNLALLQVDHLGESQEALGILEKALETDPNCRTALLVLERYYLRGGDKGAAAVNIIEKRAQQTTDLDLKAVLLWELALAREARGEVSEAVKVLRDAVSQTREKWRSLELLERLARDHQLPDVLIESLKARAALTAQAASAESDPEGVFTHLIRSLGGPEQTVRYGAILWREVARSLISLKNDPVGAVAAYERVAEIAPGDLLAHYDLMEAFELAGSLSAAAQVARNLLEKGVSGRWASALHFRLAEEARSRTDREAMRASLSAAVGADPESAAAYAALEDAWLDAGCFQELAAELESRARQLEGESRAQHLWRAGLVAADRLSDWPQAARLLQEASSARADQVPLLRERYSQALWFGDWSAANQAAAELCAAQVVDEAERGALWRERYQVTRHLLGDQETADQLLNSILNDKSCKLWAPDAVRLSTAAHGRYRPLAEAHGVLAARSEQDEVAGAHLSAAARAWLLAGDEEAAVQCLKQALVRTPANPYATALLEEILLARGAAEEVASLLQNTAQTLAVDRQGVYALLYAGMAAESAGKTELAERCYRDATQQNPEALAPIWALRRLGEKTRQPSLVLSALEMLSARESRAGGTASAAVELAQFYQLTGKAEGATELLKTSLYDQQVGLTAALSLLLLPYRLLSSFKRDAAWARVGQTATGDFAAAVARSRAAAALDHDAHQGRRELSQLINDLPKDRWARLISIRAAIDLDERSKAYIELGRVTDDPLAYADLVLHGFRIAGYKSSLEPAIDPLAIAWELARDHPQAAAATIMLDEASSVNGDVMSRAEGLRRRIELADEKARPSLQAAYARALLAGGRYPEAVEQAKVCTARDDTDVASWDVLRVAARVLGDWQTVVRACDKLAEFSDGDYRALLLEESSTVLAQNLRRDREAIQRLQEVLSADPSRKPAFELLYQLFKQSGDSRALLELVSSYLNTSGDASDFVPLMFEKARLLNSSGDPSAALASVERVLDIDPGHVGALGLKAQVNISLQRWGEAVGALRALGEGDIGAEGQRLVRTAAAELLEKRLHDPAAAYRELSVLAQGQRLDTAWYAKMAELAVSAGYNREAAQALCLAAAAAEREKRAALEGYAGKIFAELDDRAAAIEAYRRALAASSLDESACHALVELVEDRAALGEVLEAYEAAVRDKLDDQPADPAWLRRLYRIAVWRENRDLQYLVLDALCALEVATSPERSSLSALLSSGAPAFSQGRLSEASMAALCTFNQAGVPSQLIALLSSAAAALDAIGPSFYGASRDQRIDPRDHHPVRDEIDGLISALGLALGEFYCGSNDSKRIAVIAKEGAAHTWVVGKEVTAPLTVAQRFSVAQRAMAARLGLTPLLIQRSTQQAIELVIAASVAAESPFAGIDLKNDREIKALAAKVGKAMPRKLRKDLRESLHSFLGGVDNIAAFLSAARHVLLRAGLLFSGDLSIALEELFAPGFDRQTISGSPEALELVRLSTSVRLSALRREMGLAL